MPRSASSAWEKPSRRALCLRPPAPTAAARRRRRCHRRRCCACARCSALLLLLLLEPPMRQTQTCNSCCSRPPGRRCWATRSCGERRAWWGRGQRLLPASCRAAAILPWQAPTRPASASLLPHQQALRSRRSRRPGHEFCRFRRVRRLVGWLLPAAACCCFQAARPPLPLPPPLFGAPTSPCALFLLCALPCTGSSRRCLDRTASSTWCALQGGGAALRRRQGGTDAGAGWQGRPAAASHRSPPLLPAGGRAHAGGGSAPRRRLQPGAAEAHPAGARGATCCSSWRTVKALC